MAAFYNENDPVAAQWLRNLMDAGLIAPGVVDDRSIEDVTPADLLGFTQVHLFAGIGIWSHALRSAGWADERPCWTISCPCQPFSTAGEGAAFDDERHLWPDAFWLASILEPETIFGEQVASAKIIGSRTSPEKWAATQARNRAKGKVERAWLDAVFDDLEGAGYTCGAVPFPACSVGAPHIRLRTYWVAYLRFHQSGPGRRDACEMPGVSTGESRPDIGPAVSGRSSTPSGLADGDREQLRRQGRGRSQCVPGEVQGEGEQRERVRADSKPGRDASGMGNSDREQGSNLIAGDRVGQESAQASSGIDGLADTTPEGLEQCPLHLRAGEPRTDLLNLVGPGPVNGFWADADWALCRDVKDGVLSPRLRPFEPQPGSFPLATRRPGDVGQLRAFGNCLAAPQATEFIEAYKRVRGEG